MYACSLNITLHLSFQIERLKFLLCLQPLDDTWMGFMRNNYDKLLGENPKLSYLHEVAQECWEL